MGDCVNVVEGCVIRRVAGNVQSIYLLTMLEKPFGEKPDGLSDIQRLRGRSFVQNLRSTQTLYAPWYPCPQHKSVAASYLCAVCGTVMWSWIALQFDFGYDRDQFINRFPFFFGSIFILGYVSETQTSRSVPTTFM
ncbi:hypothetical protein EDB89DRAFT_1985356, partial [Lactarius sanguifluus]